MKFEPLKIISNIPLEEQIKKILIKLKKKKK
jgi:hypothetical protein